MSLNAECQYCHKPHLIEESLPVGSWVFCDEDCEIAYRLIVEACPLCGGIEHNISCPYYGTANGRRDNVYLVRSVR